MAADSNVVRFCPSCGNHYAEDSVFCRRCGETRGGPKTSGRLLANSRSQSFTPRKLGTRESFLDAEHGCGLELSPMRGVNDFLQKVQLHLAEAESKVANCSRHVDEAWSRASQQLSLFDTRLLNLDSYLSDLALQQREALAGLDSLPGKTGDRIAQLELRLDELSRDVKAASAPATVCQQDQIQQDGNEERERELDLIRLRVEALSERLSSEARVREEQFRRLEILLKTLNNAESPQKEASRDASPPVAEGSAMKHCTQASLATVPIEACSKGDLTNAKGSLFCSPAYLGEAPARSPFDSVSMMSTQNVTMPAPPVSARGSRPLTRASLCGGASSHPHHIPAPRTSSQPPVVVRHAEQICYANAKSLLDSAHALNQQRLEHEQQRVMLLQLPPRHCP